MSKSVETKEGGDLRAAIKGLRERSDDRVALIAKLSRSSSVDFSSGEVKEVTSLLLERLNEGKEIAAVLALCNVAMSADDKVRDSLDDGGLTDLLAKILDQDLCHDRPDAVGQCFFIAAQLAFRNAAAVTKLFDLGIVSTLEKSMESYSLEHDVVWAASLVCGALGLTGRRVLISGKGSAREVLKHSKLPKLLEQVKATFPQETDAYRGASEALDDIGLGGMHTPDFAKQTMGNLIYAPSRELSLTDERFGDDVRRVITDLREKSDDRAYRINQLWTFYKAACDRFADLSFVPFSSGERKEVCSLLLKRTIEAKEREEIVAVLAVCRLAATYDRAMTASLYETGLMSLLTEIIDSHCDQADVAERGVFAVGLMALRSDNGVDELIRLGFVATLEKIMELHGTNDDSMWAASWMCERLIACGGEVKEVIRQSKLPGLLKQVLSYFDNQTRFTTNTKCFASRALRVLKEK